MEEVAAGKRSNTCVDISTSDLEKNGVTKYTDIELSMRVYNSDDWGEDDIANESIHIYPFGGKMPSNLSAHLSRATL